MNSYKNIYTPKNNIYMIEDKDGKLKNIIGSEEDKLIINALDTLSARQQPSDIQDFISNKAFNLGDKK